MVSRLKFESALAGSVARWPLRGSEKKGRATPLPRRAQPLLLLFRSNPPTEGGAGVKNKCTYVGENWRKWLCPFRCIAVPFKGKAVCFLCAAAIGLLS